MAEADGRRGEASRVGDGRGETTANDAGESSKGSAERRNVAAGAVDAGESSERRAEGRNVAAGAVEPESRPNGAPKGVIRHYG